MSELFFEEIAHQAGFIYSVGNWITSSGVLIRGGSPDTHHHETLEKHLGYSFGLEDHLSIMNQKVDEGYIRLVFRNDVLFQVGCKNKEEIWGESPNFTMMRQILAKILEVEVHVFSRTFYILGIAEDILNRRFDKLQIRDG